MKITGFDAISRNLRALEEAVAGLDGEIAQISFDPNDPQSIEQAIRDVNSAIDQRIQGHDGNEVVSNITDSLKETYRAAILERASAVRLGAKDEG